MAKGEISWKRRDAEGQVFQLYARKRGVEWEFYIRERRYENWEPLDRPLLDDWLALLDGVRRRVARRLLRPEEEPRLIQRIRELFPEVDLT